MLSNRCGLAVSSKKSVFSDSLPEFRDFFGNDSTKNDAFANGSKPSGGLWNEIGEVVKETSFSGSSPGGISATKASTMVSDSNSEEEGLSISSASSKALLVVESLIEFRLNFV